MSVIIARIRRGTFRRRPCPLIRQLLEILQENSHMFSDRNVVTLIDQEGNEVEVDNPRIMHALIFGAGYKVKVHAGFPALPQRGLDEQRQRTWRAWLTATALLARALDARLHRDAGITHAAYVVLAVLSEAPNYSRRMSDLARRVNQSQSRLSHTVTQLEQRGWVCRERSTEDGRGNLAVLTDAGRDVVQSASPGHADTVRSVLFEGLTPAQTAALGEVLETVIERLDPCRRDTRSRVMAPGGVRGSLHP